MDLSDDDLLNFDADRLAAFDQGRARETLAGQHGAAYRAQLVAAHWIEGWRQRTLAYEAQFPDEARAPQRAEGWDDALREVVAHLRQGDLIPGGVLYRDESGE
jgi:hypothetical protein